MSGMVVTDERVRVRYPNGSETLLKPEIAKIKAGKKQVVILGAARAEPRKQKDETPKIDRDALIKEAIALNLGTKEDCLKLSDSELVSLVGEKK